MLIQKKQSLKKSTASTYRRALQKETEIRCDSSQMCTLRFVGCLFGVLINFVSLQWQFVPQPCHQFRSHCLACMCILSHKLKVCLDSARTKCSIAILCTFSSSSAARVSNVPTRAIRKRVYFQCCEVCFIISESLSLFNLKLWIFVPLHISRPKHWFIEIGTLAKFSIKIVRVTYCSDSPMLWSV